MIINEKGLVKALKRAIKHGGYNVFHNNGFVTIYTDYWLVQCPWGVLPRRALATIVEHMGLVPEEGEAITVEQDDEPQTYLADVAQREVEEWKSADVTGMASYVPVIFRGSQLYQDSQGRTVYAVDPDHLAILERAAAEMAGAAVTGGRALAWINAGETVMLETVRKSTLTWEWERNVWSALESVDLHKGKE